MQETLAEADRGRLSALCHAGHFLQAHRSLEELPPPAAWRGPQSRLLAARLLAPLGVRRQANAVLLHGLRAHPTSVDLFERAVLAVFERRGGLAARALLERAPSPAGAAQEAAVLAARAMVFAQLRDFAVAEAALERVFALNPDSEWSHVAASHVHLWADRHDQALAAARRALELRPAYGPAVSALAHLLQLTGRDAEAIALLADAAARTEVSYVAFELTRALQEAGRYAEAETALARAEECTPLADRVWRETFAALRFELAYHQGRLVEAQEHAAASRSPFHERQARRLAEPTDDHVLLCPVPFVRQHEKTCGPATLTALALSFGVSADHLSVADAICWGGTYGYAERRWALQNGFAAREFTLTIPAARALLARGIPFAVATQEATSGHLQAVIGHDPRRGVLIVRDPFHRHTREWLAEEFLEHYRSTGPRAMAIAPTARAADLDAVDLPDADRYDLLFAVQEALRDHDHGRARAAHAALAELDPDHALAVHSRWALSAYERDSVGVLACIERLLAAFPQDPGLRLRKLHALRELERTEDCRALLEEAVAEPRGDPAFVLQLVALLEATPEQQERRRWLLRRAARFAPGHPGVLQALATWHWERHERNEAVGLHRLAACADEFSEELALRYFRAARAAGSEAEALAFLRQRFEWAGARSSAPAISLFRALDDLGRTHEGFVVLEEALRRRPLDGDLLLTVAQVQADNGRTAVAAELLERARGVTHAVQHQATAARIAERRGDLAGALAHWRAVAAADPLRWDAHSSIADLLAATEGRERSAAHLRELAEAYPFVREPRRLLARHHGAQEPVEAIAVLRESLEVDPGDAWARRELALRLVDAGQPEEALQEAVVAGELQPAMAASHGISAYVLEQLGRHAEASTAALRALRLDADYEPAVAPAVQAAPSADARQAAAQVVFDLLLATGTGVSVSAFFVAARCVVDEARADRWLDELAARRPGLWQPRWLQIQRQLRAGRHAEARAIADALVAEFPLLPVAWYVLAQACAALTDRDGERRALREALAISPAWLDPARALCRLHVGEGDVEGARAVAERAVAHAPGSAAHRVLLADVLAAAGAPAAAADECRRAIRLDPDLDAAWRNLAELCGRDPKLGSVVEAARGLLVERPVDAGLWLRLADQLTDTKARLRALESARRLRPSLDAAYDLAAQTLADAGRFDEARAWLDSFPGSAPVNVRGRRAWLLAQQGDLDAAVVAMQEVLARHPFYPWGWFHLCMWLEMRQRWADLREAAAGYVRASPDDVVAHAQLADARLRLGEREAGMASLARAFELEPDHRWVVPRLVRAHLEAGDTGAADRVVAKARSRAPGPVATLAGLLVAAHRRDFEATVQLVMALGAEASASDEDVATAETAVRAAGLQAALDAAVGELVAQGAPHPQVARIWVQSATDARRWREAVRRFEHLLAQGCAFVPAAMFLLEELAKKDRGRLRALLGGPCRELLRGDDHTWGQAGYALLLAQRPAEVVEWLSDWRQRQAVEPWMLVNLTTALRVLGRNAEAAEVSERELARVRGSDAALHAAWLAVDAAVAGDVARARTLLALVGGDAQPLETALAALVDARLALDSGFAEAARKLRRAAARHSKPLAMGDGRRALRAIAAVIARGHGWRGLLLRAHVMWRVFWTA